jgi:hypothetical protein
LVLTFEQGAQVYWHGTHTFSPRFGVSIANPVAGFNQGGFVIVAGNKRMEVYDSKNRTTNHLDNAKLPSRAIAVLDGMRSDRFIVVTEEGDIMLWEIS